MAKKKKKGNPAALAMNAQRTQKLSPQRRSEIAKKAADARWSAKAAPASSKRKP